MKSSEIAKKAIDISTHKTIYVRKAAGQKMIQTNKLKFTSIDPFNAKRTEKIFAVSEDTEGFDEFGLIAAVIGQKFKDLGELMNNCTDISKDFSSIMPGEIVFGSDTCGIYVGDNELVYANPVLGVIKVRMDGWASHAKLNDTDFSGPEPVKEVKDESRIVDREPERSEEKTESEPEETPARNERRMDVRPDRAGRRH